MSSSRDQLLQLIKDIGIVHGKVTLSSGIEADYYVDLRRITLHRVAAPLVGEQLWELTADLGYEAVGGLTLGADPVATAVLHASGGAVDAFLVRKAQKAHGMQQQVEGPSVAGRRVLIVDDVSTTGSSPLTAARAVEEAGAVVAGVALIADRGGVDVIREAGYECRCLYSLADLGLE
ncbi:MAG: orotate phosphoribosyltransferase [Actinobacteria bacterium]|nr:orotate phosphoribosyltransferase [Actinomycetota bacterium]